VAETEVPPWEKLQDVPPVADKERFEAMQDEFYRLRGWNPDTGVPTESKLRELELHDVADQLIKEQVIVKNK
jgi:aldehyde:ferredoxin oxidoreductase